MLQEPAYREHRRTRRLSSRLSPGRYSASSTPRCCGGKDLLEGKTRDSGTAQRDGAEGQRAGGRDIAGARARRAGKRTGRRNEGPQLIPADAPGTFEMVPSQPARHSVVLSWGGRGRGRPGRVSQRPGLTPGPQTWAYGE